MTTEAVATRPSATQPQSGVRETSAQPVALSPLWKRAMPFRQIRASRSRKSMPSTSRVTRFSGHGRWSTSTTSGSVQKNRTELAYAGPVPAAPLNRIVMLTDYVAADERIVACLNQDVVYGGGSLGLEQSPVVIQVPDFGDRFWVYQAVDLRTDGFVRSARCTAPRPASICLPGRTGKEKCRKGISRFSCIDQHRLHRAAHLHGRYTRRSRRRSSRYCGRSCCIRSRSMTAR